MLITCTFWCDVMQIAPYLWALPPPKPITPLQSWGKKINQLPTEVHATKYPSSIAQNSQGHRKNKGSLRNCHSQEEPRETWWLGHHGILDEKRKSGSKLRKLKYGDQWVIAHQYSLMNSDKCAILTSDATDAGVGRRYTDTLLSLRLFRKLQL